MKTRSGFVSNSSSCSFLIYGASLSKDEIEKVNLSNTCLSEFYGDPNSYNRSYYIGCSWDEVKDDETGKEFRERVEKDVAKVYKEISCSTHEESYYNG